MSGKQLVQSLARGLEILELLSRAPHGITLAQLAAELDVSRPTAFNLARTLVAKGYVVKTAKPVHYALGPAVTSLYQNRWEVAWRRETEAELRSLVEAFTGVRVSVAECFGDEILETVCIDPAQGNVLVRPLGSIVMPYTMVLSLCFQAFWPAMDREHYERRYLFADYGRGVWANQETLGSFLDMCRAKGCVQRRSAGQFRVAAPIYGLTGRLIATLSAALPSAEGAENVYRIEACSEAITGAAERLSH